MKCNPFTLQTLQNFGIRISDGLVYITKLNWERSMFEATARFASGKHPVDEY